LARVRKIPPCGTDAGYHYHRRVKGEPADGACLEAHNKMCTHNHRVLDKKARALAKRYPEELERLASQRLREIKPTERGYTPYQLRRVRDQARRDLYWKYKDELEES
jgi:hypothetical protein